MDEAGSRVVDDGSGKITIPDGESLALTWGDATMRGVRKGTVRVTGAGTLTVTVGGEPYASLTAADGEQTFSFLSKNLSAYDFGFAFAGEGSATLSGFDFVGGMMITIR